ncbi:hypothetical protein AMATHDRAFT_69605 [Amanita thiersii Skay4041]|uniref:Protein phosphatase n=1 Tax=Amanita thiersii Skay4041 TaxID=703135 RepID=A0A2A9NFQ8_9AGAR|nr:hypothetical protein AMATHDRAFT_69605 [Amanita thiersii Skay4041]
MKSIQKRIYTVLPRVAGATTASPSVQPSIPSPSTPPPRVRSNSLSSSTNRSFHTAGSGLPPLAFFDSPPPPSSRSSLPSPNRLLVEAKPSEIEGPQNPPHGQSSQHASGHPPFSLALTQPQGGSNGHTLVNNSLGTMPGHASLFAYSLSPAPKLQAGTPPKERTRQQHSQAKRHKLKYQLHVGAYGIPKDCASQDLLGSRGRVSRSKSEEDLSLAVQVGEDAYFVKDNAMGVADGVGGWAKTDRRERKPLRSRAASPPTSSAMFARRLMHYCSTELDTLSRNASLSPSPPNPSQLPPSQPQFTFSSPKPRPTPIIRSHASSIHWSDSCTSTFLSSQFISSSLPSSFTFTPPSPTSKSAHEEVTGLQEDLEDSLEELSDGINVLQILERAYDRTLKAHVEPAPPSPPDPRRSVSPSLLSKQQPGSEKDSTKPVDLTSTPSWQSSSTRASDGSGSNVKTEMVPLLRGSSTALLAILDHVPRHEVHENPSDGSAPYIQSISTTNTEEKGGYDAVIKIANLGDCMAMLVRGEEIAWRSQEMVWSFNTPKQLGPTSPTAPSDAHVFRLPVRADDILILSTDGLSDNLWDEEILNEVIMCRKAILGRNHILSTGSEVDGQRHEDGSARSPTISAAGRALYREILAKKLSEALCSRARRVSERPPGNPQHRRNGPLGERVVGPMLEKEIPFARRAREAGKEFFGGKIDDISVIVAVISPAADAADVDSGR